MSTNFLYHFFKKFSKSQSFIFSVLIVFFVGTSAFSWANIPISTPLFSPSFSLNSPKDTTLVIEKDIYPKIVNQQERLIEGKKYIFATINDKKGMVARAENFLSEMARAAGIEVVDFLDWNDMKPTDAIQTGQVYYLEQKENRAKDVVTHVLTTNETLWDVSQKYAIRYKYLLKYNRLSEEDKVKTGLVVWIQTKRPKKVPAEIRDVTPIVATFEESEEEEEADPELMAEWEELKKTELVGLDKQKDKTTTTTNTNSDKQNTNTTDKTEEGTFAEFEEEKESKTDSKTEQKTETSVVKYHVVAEAESLYDISKKYNVVMSKLKEWNNLPDYETRTGQRLIVSQPNSGKEDKVYEGNLITEKTEVKKTDTKQETSSDKKVVVKQNANGDFVSFIDSSGVLLPIPQQDFYPIAPNMGDKNYHIVEKDETLWSIARKYNLSPKDVIRWNGFVTGDNIDVGDKIILNPSLALPEGSRSDVKKVSNSSQTGTNQGAETITNPDFKDPSLGGTETNTGQNDKNKTSASKLTREEIITMGGNPDNVGKEGYGELGELLPNYVSNKKADTTKIIEANTEKYVVQPQDALGKIAQKFGVTTKEIMEWNPKIPANGTIYKGDTLLVSQPKNIKTQETKTQETKKTETATIYPAEYYGAGFHAVQPNDKVYTLSEKYGVPVAKIRSWNNLSEDAIDLPVGKKMIINEGVLKMGNNDTTTASKKEEKKTDATTQMNYSYHSVEKGETLFSIAQKYNLSTAQVREWNNRQGDLVYEGEKLIVGVK